MPASSFEPYSLLGEIQRRVAEDRQFREPLMRLYHILGEDTKAFETALAMEPPYAGFFQDITDKGHFKFILAGSNFGVILRAYPHSFPDFLMDHIAELEPAQILKQVQIELDKAARSNDETAIEVVERFKLSYLDRLYSFGHALFDREENGTELALMYIKFMSPKAMKFLTENTNFRLMQVRAAAVQRGMYREVAFLYKRVGDAVGGMGRFLDHIGDPQGAIDYAKSCYIEKPVGRRGEKKKKPDKEVWQMLIRKSYRDGDFLREMLIELPNLDWKPKHSVKFIQEIPDTSIVPNFEELASRTVKEYRRKLTTAKLTQDIVAKDAFGAFKRSFDRYKMGKPTQFY
jgi:hypothetical protein